MESSISWKRRFRKVLTPLKRRVFKSANQILVNSSFSKQLVSDRCHVDPNKIQVVCPGVDPDLFYPEERAADLVFRYSLTGKKVFLTLTRLDDYKGIDHAILAMKQVIQKYPEVLYLVCGEGRDRGRLEKLIQETALGAHVILVGAIPFDRLRDYYNLADVFVLLSREHQEPPDVEGFGIVFLEAAACGKPVIAGQSGGISDAVKEGVSGWLVPPTDDAAISRAMLEALEKPEKCLKLGHLTRARVLSEFTWKHMAEKTNKIIQQLLWNPLGRD